MPSEVQNEPVHFYFRGAARFHFDKGWENSYELRATSYTLADAAIQIVALITPPVMLG
jgi:hypothetical protein